MEEKTQKQIVRDFLEEAYTGAKAMGDLEMECRISRAIIAFSYNDMEKTPTWGAMLESFIQD